MDYKKYFCPVCNENFNDNDDVVVCPDCGTPHHRECWRKNGKCFNNGLHGTQEDIRNKFTRSDVAQETQIKEPEKVVHIEIGNDGEKTENSFGAMPDNPFKIDPSQSFLIDGKFSVYYDIAVRKNQSYYIPSFMAMSQNKKIISWNFWAFLVPLAWSIYRKMYKLSAIILAIYMLILGVTGYFYFSNKDFVNATTACIEEDPNYLENIALYTSGADVTLTVKQQELIKAMENIQIPSYIGLTGTVLLMGCRVFMGLKANKEYMKAIKKTIEKGERKGLTDDKLKMYIFRKQGIIPIFIPVIIGIFEWLTIY